MVLCVAEMYVLFLSGGTHSQFTTNPITQKHGGVGRLNAHIRINTTKTLYGKGKQCAALLIFIFCRRPFIVVCLHCCCHSFIFITVNIIFFWLVVLSVPLSLWAERLCAYRQHWFYLFDLVTEHDDITIRMCYTANQWQRFSQRVCRRISNSAPFWRLPNWKYFWAKEISHCWKWIIPICLMNFGSIDVFFSP